MEKITSQNHAKKLRNLSSEILEKKHLSIVEKELVAAAAAADAGKTASKKQLPAAKHHGSEGRARSKTTRKKCVTCRLKS